MHGAFCDQPWPGNDAGDDPGLSVIPCSGQWRYAAHTVHTVRLPDVSALSVFCLHFAKMFCRYFAERRRKISKTPRKTPQFVKFP